MWDDGQEIWDALMADLRDEGTHVFQLGYTVYLYVIPRIELPEAQHVG